MPKQSIQLSDLNFSIGTASSGTYFFPNQITIDSTGRLTSVTTSASTVLPGPGLVSSLKGDNTTTTVNTSTGYVALDLTTVTNVSTSLAKIKSITVDAYGRVNNFTTNSFPQAGTYTNVSSLTLDSQGRVTAINTATYPGFNVTGTATIYNATLLGRTNLSQNAENLVNLGSGNGIINVDTSQGNNFYFTPTGWFAFNFTNVYTSGGTSSFNSTNPTVTVSIIVNNTAGNSYWSTGTVGINGYSLPTSSITLYWVGKITPVGNPGKIEIYAFNLVWTGLSSLLPTPFGGLTVYG